MIQIRNVPERVHQEYRRRAAAARMSLSDYLLADMERRIEKPSIEEWLERLKTREPVSVPDVVEVVRAERESR